MSDRERQNLQTTMAVFLVLPLMAYGINRLLFYLLGWPNSSISVVSGGGFVKDTIAT